MPAKKKTTKRSQKTSSRSAQILDAIKACERTGYNPFVELIKIARETVTVDGVEVPATRVSERITIARTLAEYVMPKQKASDAKPGDNELTILLRHFVSDIKGDQSPRTKPKKPGEPTVVLQHFK